MLYCSDIFHPCRDVGASKTEEYSSLKEKAEGQDRSVSGGEKVPPNMRYPDHGKNTSV